MAKEVYIAAVGLTKLDLTGQIFASVFDLFARAYQKAPEDSSIRSETASSTGAAAFHEAHHKVASGQADNGLVLAGERMKIVTTTSRPRAVAASTSAVGCSRSAAGSAAEPEGELESGRRTERVM
jgi:acetyl-CoA acetyltransferase